MKEIFKKIIRNKYFLPFLIIFTDGVLFLDTFKYPGFVGKHFFVDARIIAALAVVLLFFYANKKMLQFFLNLNFVLFLFLFAIYVFFNLKEAAAYPNYVLSSFGFHLDGLVYIVVFSFLVWVTCVIALKTKVKLDLKAGISLFLATCLLVVSFGTTLNKVIIADLYIITHFRDSYDQKMVYQWGNYYKFIKFVKENTPEDSVIITPPPLEVWSRIGNTFLDKYFLYPRKLVQPPDINLGDNLLKDETYVMVSWGDWNCDRLTCEIWPQQKIKARVSIFMNVQNGKIKIIKENAIYDPENSESPYGLLKI